MYQMPLEGENFKWLKAACIKSDAWLWIQDYNRAPNGMKAWLALVAHYDGTGELSKRIGY